MRIFRLARNLSRFSQGTRLVFIIGQLSLAAGLLSSFLVPTEWGLALTVSTAGLILILISAVSGYIQLRLPVERREVAHAHEADLALRENFRNPLWAAASGLKTQAGQFPKDNADGAADLLSSDLPESHEAADGLVWLLASARYQLLELLPLLRQLNQMGIPAQLVSHGRPTQGIAREAQIWSEKIYRADLSDLVPRVLVVLNDWGADRVFAQNLRAKGTVLISKVEGAQDFSNLDTPRTRLPYSNSDVVLAQGKFDALEVHAKRVEIVGSSRIESLLALRETASLEAPIRPAVTNFNFSYGTYTSSADAWIRRVLAAHEALNLTVHISLHPAVSRGSLATDDLSKWPLALDLETSESLISRASTAIFDALAIGRRVNYFNPHGERLWRKIEWNSAVPEIRSHRHLVEALAVGNAREEYLVKERIAFLKNNFISVMPGVSSEFRAAQVIAKWL